MKKPLIVSLLVSSLSLSGCTGLLFGGAVAGGAAVATTLHDRRTPGTVIDDRNLEIVIARKLSANKSLKQNSHINLTVFNGVVLVTGEAASQQIADSILNIVRSTANVKRVQSDIMIMPNSSILNRTNDAGITAKVKTAIMSLNIPNFDSSLINVTTERGNAYLMGLVTRDEAQAIIDKARRVSGVRAVIDVFEYIDAAQKTQTTL